MADNDEGGRTEDLGTFQMLWDCQYCGQKKLLALTHKHCPSCGAPQGDPKLRYFPADENAVAVANHQFAGADIVCAHCQAKNGAKAKHCATCGAPLARGQVAGTRRDQVIADGQSFTAETAADAKAEKRAAEMTSRSPAPPPGKRMSAWLLVPVALVAGLYFVCRKHDAAVVVTGHAWERTIVVESYRPRAQSAWCDSIPPDARGVRRERAERSTRRVPDGEECSLRRADNGDGTFTKRRECRTKYRNEPVYDDRCYYTVDRWGASRTVRSQGASLSDAPRWPELTLRSGDCIGCEREGGRTEKYRLELTEEEAKQRVECELPESRWRSAAVGSRWVVRTGMTGADCSSMKPAK